MNLKTIAYFLSQCFGRINSATQPNVVVKPEWLKSPLTPFKKGGNAFAAIGVTRCLWERGCQVVVSIGKSDLTDIKTLRTLPLFQRGLGGFHLLKLASSSKVITFKHILTCCLLAVSTIFWTGCQTNTANQPATATEESTTQISDDSLFNLVQYQTFQYFWDGAEPNSGMAPERKHMDGVYPQNDQRIVTIGGSGFGVMAILVGIERGYISREEGRERLQKIVDFLEAADRFHGAWPHWLDGKTGKTKPFSRKDNGGDLVETAFMVQGLLAVRQYFSQENEAEQALAEQIDQLWQEVEWDWYTQGKNVLYWHWSPNYGWEMNFPVGGYNECLIMYVLAAASPTHPITPEVYHEGWARNGDIQSDETYYGYDLVLDHYEHDDDPVGPLFWAHYSYLGLDPRNLTDQYGDYWKLNQNHALTHLAYCKENPENYVGYGENCWGLTSSYSMRGYAGHRPGQDLGVISPTAALSSFPYTPEPSMAAMRHFYDSLGDQIWGEYGFYDAFSQTRGYYPPRYLAIDQGPIVVMMENHRSGLLWDLFMSCPEVQQGLGKLGFETTVENSSTDN